MLLSQRVKRENSEKTGDDAAPERAPEIKARIELSWKQRLGFPILIAIPILALFGVFGETEARTHLTTGPLDVRVSYPTRFRYRQVSSLHVTVQNVSSNVLDTVSVAFDTAYVSRFSGVRFDPAPRVAFTVQLTNVKPSESRLISVELWGQDYGNHRGTIIARSGSDSAIAHLETLVFP
ncbi:MAG: hypothetical protein NVSMB53_15760 [Gemmatimonadaceae bacterium]